MSFVFLRRLYKRIGLPRPRSTPSVVEGAAMATQLAKLPNRKLDAPLQKYTYEPSKNSTRRAPSEQRKGKHCSYCGASQRMPVPITGVLTLLAFVFA